MKRSILVTSSFTFFFSIFPSSFTAVLHSFWFCFTLSNIWIEEGWGLSLIGYILIPFDSQHLFICSIKCLLWSFGDLHMCVCQDIDPVVQTLTAEIVTLCCIVKWSALHTQFRPQLQEGKIQNTIQHLSEYINIFKNTFQRLLSKSRSY